MTSLIAGTWSLISSSAEVITGARRMTVRIQRLLKLEKIELSESDRRRLLGLQKRVECLVQPLNFLLLWSKKRDSCVQQAVLSAQELLFDVCGYVERFVPQDGSGGSLSASGGKPGSGPLDSEQLEYYLRELEFACASVSMAVNIAREIDAPLLQKPTPLQEAGADPPGVSLSALLRASRLIQEMRGRSGDLCACPGRLYSEVCRPRDAALSDGSGIGKVYANGRSDGALSRQEMEEWAPMLSLATFKVVATMDTRKGRRRYGISVESRRPLSQRDSSPPPSLDDADNQSPRGGLNAGGPLSFPIEVALDACLATTSRMALPVEPARYTRELGIDSLVLVWGGAVTTCIEPASGEVSTEFPDVVLLPDAAAEVQGLPHPLRPSPHRLAVANPLAARCPPGCTRFAFVFDGPRGNVEGRCGDSEVALTPLDALYLARLCALDDGHHGAFLQDGCVDGAAACPPHLLSSDEVLAALLQEGTTATVVNMDNGCRTAKHAHNGAAAGVASKNGTTTLAWAETAD